MSAKHAPVLVVRALCWTQQASSSGRVRKAFPCCVGRALGSCLVPLAAFAGMLGDAPCILLLLIAPRWLVASAPVPGSRCIADAARRYRIHAGFGAQSLRAAFAFRTRTEGPKFEPIYMLSSISGWSYWPRGQRRGHAATFATEAVTEHSRPFACHGVT